MNTEESVKLLARVDERTIMIQERIDDFIEQSQENCQRCFDDHERRIRTLERWQWKSTGIVAGIVGFIGAIPWLLDNWKGGA